MNQSGINCLAEFKDPEAENLFREQALPGSRGRVYFGALAISVIWLLFVPMDYHLFGLSWAFFLLLMLRFWQACMGAALCIFVRRTNSHKKYEFAVCLFWLMTFISIYAVNSTRPGTFFLHIFVDIMAVLLSYVMMPNRLLLQMPPAFLFTALGLHQAVVIKQPDNSAVAHVIIMAYLLINIFGIFMSWQRNMDYRRRYLAICELKSANKDLEKALNEIKTLKGIIPICAHCKKIRDDQGYWNQLEQFMATRLDAEFSHGLCPDCMSELYPEVAERVFSRRRSEEETQAAHSLAQARKADEPG